MNQHRTLNFPAKSTFMALAATAATLLAAPSWAAPTQLQEQQSVEISASPDKVWGIIKNFNDLTWVAVVKASNATKGNTIGSIRTLEMGGPKLTEELVQYNASAHSYTYAIQNTAANQQVVPLSDVKATISVAPGKDGGSKVTWQAAFHRVDHSDTPAAGHDDAAAKQTMNGVIGGGLASLKQKAEVK
ncbi:SRPBCC family protein [Duganella aceris]|uniref:SRPBCC family protein n=1 Tax=Duganella aceris TaxID=2703883 RepID=A0ABX0FKJ9_9BURK|nr:SRPBCC family protein [Duganella aceris]NGZ85086.1 SRPBCC family protein [Duganella aceris]